MQEKYNVTGMTCAACQAKYKSVSNLTGVQECNVNLLKNSMVVTLRRQKCKQWADYRFAVEKAGYGASTAGQGKISCCRLSPRWTRRKGNMRRCAVE